MKTRTFFPHIFQITLLIAAILLTIGITGPTEAQETITLYFRGGHWTEDIRQWIDSEIIPEFQRSHPHIEVEIQYAAGADASLSVLKAAGMMPDIFFGSISEAVRWGMPLDHYTKDWNELSDIPPALLEAAQLDGAQMAIPWSLSLRHFFYRIDLFEEAGLDAEAPPRNWQDLLQVVPHLIRYGGAGETIQYPIVGSDVWLIETFYYQAGGTPYPVVPIDADWLEYDPALTVFEYMEELYQTAYPNVGPRNFRGESFRGGRSAIGYDSSRLIESIFEDMDPSLIGAFPSFSMTSDSPPVAVVNNNGLIISRDSDRPDAAWEFLSVLASAENTARYNEYQIRIPPRISVMTGSSTFESPVLNLALPLMDNAMQSFLIEFGSMGSTVNPILNSEITAMFQGQKSPIAAVEEVRSQIKAAQAAAKGE